MRALPLKAQIYLWITYAAGLLCATSVYVIAPRLALSSWREMVIFVVLAAVSSGKKIQLVPKKADEDHGSTSLEYMISFAALLRFGPAGALPVAIVGTLGSVLFPKRQKLHQAAFNLAQTAVYEWAGGMIYLIFNGWHLTMTPQESLLAAGLSILASYFINTGSIALIISYCTEQSPTTVWKESFLWVGPSYFVGGCISYVAILIMGRNSGAILAVIAPMAYLIYQAYAYYASRAADKQRHIDTLADLYLATVKSLALAIDAKDQYTHQHILRVQTYSIAIAKEMGLKGPDMDGLATGALLHDIGKLGVPEYVLLKPGRLTDEEFAKIKRHPEIGAAILDPVTFPWPVLPVVKYHHERWDGTGYPEGLAGEDIPLTARILAVGDVYDALTSSRSYRAAWSHERAIECIKEKSAVHFDPAVVDAFLKVIDGVRHEMRVQQAKDQESQDQESHSARPNDSFEPHLNSRKAAEAVRYIQRASTELWALYEVSQTLSSSLGLQETLDILARKLDAILPGTGCVFLMQDGDALVARSAVGINSDHFIQARATGAGSASLQVSLSRTSFLGPFDHDDLLLTSVPLTAWTDLRSGLIVPIVHQEQVLGTINLYHPQENAFGAHDQQLLETIAERSAMALHNGILFERTRSHAFRDQLTGLYNLRYFTDWVETRCARGDRAADKFALLCLDLDSFKPINDNFGHQKGDLVLQDLSAIFLSLVRQEDLVARYGGDEFLIILDGAGPEEAAAMADRLQIAVETYDPKLIHQKLGALRLGASIGYACFPSEGRDCAALIAKADTGMYSNKTERKLGTLVDRNGGKDLDIRLTADPGIPAAAVHSSVSKAA